MNALDVFSIPVQRETGGNHGNASLPRGRPGRTTRHRRHPDGQRRGYTRGGRHDVRARIHHPAREAPAAGGFAFDYTTDDDGDCSLYGGSDNDGVLTITHESGDVIEADRLRLVTSADERGWSVCNGSGGAVSATDSAEVSVDETGRTVWTAPNGEQSTVIGNWDGEEEAS